MPSLSSKLCNGNNDYNNGNYCYRDASGIISENGYKTNNARGRKQQRHNFQSDIPERNSRKQRRARSSSTHRYYRGESKSPDGMIQQRLHRRNSYAGDSYASHDKPIAVKNAISVPLRSSSQSSSIANRPRNSKGRASNRQRSYSRATAVKTSRSTSRDRSNHGSTSGVSSMSSYSSGTVKTKQERSTVNNERKDSRRHKEKNVKRANSDGVENISYSKINEKKEDIAKIEKRLEYIRQMARDLEIELQQRRNENAGEAEEACSANNRHCSDPGDDMDNVSLATLRLSNRSVDRGITTRTCDGISRERDCYEDKQIEKTHTSEPIKLYVTNRKNLASDDVMITTNTKEATRSTVVGEQPESKSPTAAQRPSENTTAKLRGCYPRRATTGGIPVGYHSKFCLPTNHTSPFREFKKEKKFNPSGEFPDDAESHLISTASTDLTKYSIVVRSTEDSVSSLSVYSQDNKNSSPRTHCKSQEIKENKDSQNYGDVVLIENLDSQKNQASTYSTSTYSRKYEGCLSYHKNDTRTVNAQSQTSLLVEKNDPSVVATSDVDILPSSAIVCSAQPPPPPRKTPTISSISLPSSLDSSKSLSPAPHCSSQQPVPSSSQSNANDNDSEPTASTSSSTANSSSLSSISTSMKTTRVIQSGQVLPESTSLGSLSGGSEEIMSKSSLVSTGVERATTSINNKDSGAKRNSTPKKRLSVTFQHPLEEIMTSSETKITCSTEENSLSGRVKDGHVPVKLQQPSLPPHPKKQSYFPPPHRDRRLQFHRSNSMDSKFTHSNSKSNCNKGREDFAFVNPPPPPPRHNTHKSDGKQTNGSMKTRDPKSLEVGYSYDLDDIIASTQAKYDETVKKDDLGFKNASRFRPPPPRRRNSVCSEVNTMQRNKSRSSVPPPPARG